MYSDTGIVAKLKWFLFNRDICNVNIEMYIANGVFKLLIKSESEWLIGELKLQYELDKTLNF